MGRAVWGDVAVVFSATALILCVVPAALSLIWADWAYRQSADQQFTMLLGATGLRMFVVLIGAYLLHSAIPYLQRSEALGFWLWVVIFYLVTLGLETVLSLRGRPAASGSLPTEAPPPVNRVG